MLITRTFHNTSSLDVIMSMLRTLEYDGSIERSRKLGVDGMILMKTVYGYSERYGDLSTCREGG